MTDRDHPTGPTHPRLERDWTVGSAPGGATLFRQAGGAPAAGTLPEATFGWTMHADPRGAWHLVAATLTEALSTCYELRADVLAPGPFPELAALLGSRATLTITRGARTRRVHGVLREVTELGTSQTRRAHVRVTVVPELALLAQRTDSRVFAHQTAVETVRRVLAAARCYTAAPPTDYLDPRHGPLRRTYTVQYQESDLAFVQRLLEDEGLAYYFDHDDAAAETLVIVDGALGASASVFPDVPAGALDGGVVGDAPPAVFAMALQAEAALRPDETVHALEPRGALGATAVTLRDHDFTNAGRKRALTATATATAPGDARARYEYPGHYVLTDSRARGLRGSAGRPDDGVPHHDTSSQQRFVTMRLQEQQWPGQTWCGAGNVTGLTPGHALRVVDHARVDPGHDAFVVVAAGHTLRAPEVLEQPAAFGATRYANTFTLLPRGVTYRPPRVTPRATIAGPQTATVVGLPGEEIHTDAYGRVRVQFHWDRQHAADAPVSGPQPGLSEDPGPLCWVRCAQAWAGPQWGASFVPRVGMEVVVVFLDGDPDRPLVVGSVYNSQHPPPFGLPGGATRNGLRTRSTPGGLGFNELSFEDAAGAEQVYLHAQRDLREDVRRNHDTHAAGDQTNTVDGDQTETIGHVQRLTVRADRHKTIERNETITVHADRTATVRGVERVGIGGAPAAAPQPLVAGDRDVLVHHDDVLFVAHNQTTTVGEVAEHTANVRLSLMQGDTQVHLRDHAVHVLAGAKVEITSPTEIRVRCGQSTLVLTPDAIELVAPDVRVRSAGGALVHLTGPDVRLNCT